MPGRTSAGRCCRTANICASSRRAAGGAGYACLAALSARVIRGAELVATLHDLRDDNDAVTSVREAVQAFTGIGPLGADIFCREVQAVWPSLRPFADMADRRA